MLFLKATPAEMLQRIASHFQVEDSPALRQQLTYKSQTTAYKKEESLQEYIDRHLDIRSDMERISYPGIEDEKIKVLFIINGLRQHLALQQHIPIQTITSPPTIQECK